MCIVDVLKDENLQYYIKITSRNKIKDNLADIVLSSFGDLSLNERSPILYPWQRKTCA